LYDTKAAVERSLKRLAFNTTEPRPEHGVYLSTMRATKLPAIPRVIVTAEVWYVDDPEEMRKAGVWEGPKSSVWV